ncbi:MAG: hypothetical protein DSY77_08190 [Bacteroidetes bacterium]|nr:MAG: hypothetical protein DSY77_08190 [Bacteroidota bacterium]
MILHFLKDEKVSDQVIENFNSVYNHNLFIIFTEEEEKINYTKSRGENIKFYWSKASNLDEFLLDIHYKALIFHSLNPEFVQAFKFLAGDFKIVWFEWGYDLYNLPQIKPGLLGEESLKYLKGTKPFIELEWLTKKHPLLRKLYYKFIERKEDPYASLFKILSQTSYFASYMLEEYQLFIRKTGSDMDFLHCEISSLEQYLAGDKEAVINNDASNVLVGNSNSIESNHLDVIKFLSNQNHVFGDSELHLILSYGKDENYKGKVISELKRNFGDKGVAIQEFMGRDEYINYLKKFSVAIFYHFRQQAMGNIIALLVMGVRIYMSSKNPAYQYFKRNGVNIYALQEDFSRYGISKLSKQQVDENRQIIKPLFSKDRVIKNTNNLVKVLIGDD